MKYSENEITQAIDNLNDGAADNGYKNTPAMDAVIDYLRSSVAQMAESIEGGTPSLPHSQFSGLTDDVINGISIFINQNIGEWRKHQAKAGEEKLLMFSVNNKGNSWNCDAPADDRFENVVAVFTDDQSTEDSVFEDISEGFKALEIEAQTDEQTGTPSPEADEFQCEGCEKIGDIEDSVKVDEKLLCVTCSIPSPEHKEETKATEQNSFTKFLLNIDWDKYEEEDKHPEWLYLTKWLICHLQREHKEFERPLEGLINWLDSLTDKQDPDSEILNKLNKLVEEVTA